MTLSKTIPAEIYDSQIRVHAHDLGDAECAVARDLVPAEVELGDLTIWLAEEFNEVVSALISDVILGHIELRKISIVSFD